MQIGRGINSVSADEYLKRFVYVTILLIPLIILTDTGLALIQVPDFSFRPFIQVSLTTIVVYYARVVFENAFSEFKQSALGVMTLEATAIAIGYCYSVGDLILHGGTSGAIELVLFIWVILFVHVLLTKIYEAVGSPLTFYDDVIPHHVHVFRKDEVDECPVYDLHRNDIVLVKSGGRIPGDGVIRKGAASISLAHLTGEVRPVKKVKGDKVIAGSLCVDGSIEVEIEAVGEDSIIGKIKKFIGQTAATKLRLQVTAESASSTLAFSALGVSLGTIIVWLGIVEAPYLYTLTIALAVLLIASPNALRLSVQSTATTALIRAIRSGIFIKNFEIFEKTQFADYIVFEKKGIFANGSFSVQKIVILPQQAKSVIAKNGEDDIIAIAAALEHHSNHPIGSAILGYARDHAIAYTPALSVSEKTGKGIEGIVGSLAYGVGSRSFMKDEGLWNEDAEKLHEQTVREGGQAIYIADTVVFGAIIITNTTHMQTRVMVEKLHALGLTAVLMSEESDHEVHATAELLGLDHYLSGVAPDDMHTQIKKMQDDGHTVIMVGDEHLSSSSLTQADVAIVMKDGIDLSLESGDVILTNKSPADIIKVMLLGRALYQTMFEGFAGSLAYNMIAIPLAAGALFRMGILIHPSVAVLLMALSVIVVAFNSLRLKHVSIDGSSI